MNDFTPHKVTEKTDFNRWTNKVVDALKANKVNSSDDILVTSNTNGTYLKLAKKQPMNETGWIFANPRNTGSNDSNGSGDSGLDLTFVYNYKSDYAKNSVVLVEPWNTASLGGASSYNNEAVESMPGWYVCYNDTSNYSGSFDTDKYTGTNIPENPPVGSNPSWVMINPYPAQEYKITEIEHPDYYLAEPYGDTEWDGDAVPIAKPRGFRSEESSSIDDVTIHYNYTDDNNRMAYDGEWGGTNTNYEYQCVFPRINVGDIITAHVPNNGTGVEITDGKSVWLQEMLPNRVWARRYNAPPQST